MSEQPGQHTAGEWRVGDTGRDGSVWVTMGAQEYKVAVAVAGHPPEEIAAIRRAFAAAPDMRAALIRLEAAARSRDVTMGDPCALLAAKAELDAAAREARAALAKTTEEGAR